MATKRRYGRVLTPQKTLEIFSYKTAMPATSYAKVRLKHGNDLSVQVGKLYNVSPKTIRDIWNRRSWRSETSHLWHLTKGQHNMHNQPADHTNSVDHTQSTDCKSSAILPNTPASWNYQHQETLPTSSSEEDPFHDDWQYWNTTRDTECQIADFVFL